jgi:hypothetical protein
VKRGLLAVLLILGMLLVAVIPLRMFYGSSAGVTSSGNKPDSFTPIVHACMHAGFA